MTTTSHLQNKPDYYESMEECKKHRTGVQSNARYANFKQGVFHCGDEEQFYQYKDPSNYKEVEVDLESNIFNDQNCNVSELYEDIDPTVISNTFQYILHKFKKGIFVKIACNELKVFLPFSKANYTNEWADRIKVNPKFKNMHSFLQQLSRQDGYTLKSHKINNNLDNWYANNSLVRYEFPIHESDTNVQNIKNMLEELCESRSIPNIEFFVNRRDFPILTNDRTEPYYNIFNKNTPLVSHSYAKYAPILSMSKTDHFADVLIPTWDDWARIQSYQNKWFPHTCKSYDNNFTIKWEDKIETAVFRGASTGCGVSIKTNPRLNISYMSHLLKSDKSVEIPYLDAGITKWKLRPRKLENEKYLQYIDIDSLPFGLVDTMSPLEQSGYKYIVNIDGHVTAFRLSLELCMGSVILIVGSEWTNWYKNMLVDGIHYISIKSDLSNLIEKIQWCRNNDDACKQIAINAKSFYEKYLQKDGILDHLQYTLTTLKKAVGYYMYNTITPIDIQLQEEENNIISSLKLNPVKIYSVPETCRSFNKMEGLRLALGSIVSSSKFEEVSECIGILIDKVLCIVTEYQLAGFSFVVKSTSDVKKKKELIHETYLGFNCINNLLKSIPNFAYIFGMYSNSSTLNITMEKIHGITLEQYINSDEFQFGTFMFILLQICLAIHVAQNQCALIHWDLAPWNIIIKKLDTSQQIDYIIDDIIYRITTNTIPVIIDYGKSHVVHNNEHHGFINMYSNSQTHDMISLVILSFHQIINRKHKNTERNLDQFHLSTVFKIINKLFANSYLHPSTFDKVHNINSFLTTYRKYSNLINIHKQKDLTHITPTYMIKLLLSFNYNLPVTQVCSYTNTMNIGNPSQVLNYILSETTEERIKSYTDVLTKLSSYTLRKEPVENYMLLFVANFMYQSLTNVYNDFMFFLEKEQLENVYVDLYTSALNNLQKTFKNVINSKKITCDISLYEEYIPFEVSYDQDIFTTPHKILDIMNNDRGHHVNYDFSYNKELLQHILLNKNNKLSDADKRKYKTVGKKILNINSFAHKCEIANRKSLYTVAKKIYEIDAKFLNNLPNNEKNKYTKIYEEISKIL